MTTTELTNHTYETASLTDWQREFWLLYGHHDADAPLFSLVLQMVVDATRVGEAIRKGNLAEALPYVPRTFTWLLNIITKCAEDPTYGYVGLPATSLAELTWQKYPNRCSLCAEPRCLCPWLGFDKEEGEEREKTMEERASILQAARADRKDFPTTLTGWSMMFQRIYGVPHARMSMHEKGLHLMEEVGEVEYELLKAERVDQNKIPTGREEEYSRIDFAGELADVFSWLLTVHHHILLALHGARDFMSTYQERSGVSGKRPSFQIELPKFSDWLWVEFGDHNRGLGLRCHRCTSSPCSCQVAIKRR